MLYQAFKAEEQRQQSAIEEIERLQYERARQRISDQLMSADFSWMQQSRADGWANCRGRRADSQADDGRADTSRCGWPSTVLRRPASHGFARSMSPARFVRNSTGGFVPSKRSATPTAASPRLNVSVVMSSTENFEGGFGGGGGVEGGVVFSDMMAGGCD